MTSISHFIPLIGPFILAQKQLEEKNHNFKLNLIYSFQGYNNN